jgi:pSer/pThr/pTyr-binding forkhead associated (FHA) protein
MVQRAFEARTDTLATWALLQKHCMLLIAEQERSASALSDRIRDVRQTKIDTGELTLKQPQPEAPKKSVIRRIRPPVKPRQQSPADRVDKPAQPTPEYLKPVSPPPPEKRPLKQLKRLSTSRFVPADASRLYWLTVTTSKRHIALPVTGQLSLGHFDPNVGIPPDIDLTFEDQASHFISRRHAIVVGQDGAHTIEDLGSRAGVFLNGTQVSNGPSRPLEEGDRISLGDIELVYEKVPTGVLIKAKSSQARHALMVTPTGRVIGLTPLKDIVIGRADPQVNFMPDIDLSVDGEVARLVSRRHAIIRWREGQPHLEDLGSGFGSRLGGDTLTLGQSVPLKPGDHFWLAGCVLAYAVEL